MKTELKIGIIAALAALIGSVITGSITYKAADTKSGTEWDLKRAATVFNEATKRHGVQIEQKITDGPSVADWACYYSRVYDCIMQEWSPVSSNPDRMLDTCPPKEPVGTSDSCDHPGTPNK